MSGGWELRPTTRFRKDVRMLKKRGRDLKKLEAALCLLQETGELPASYRPHPLRGELSGCLDAHIEPDWLLIYEVLFEQRIIVLRRSGRHVDIFRSFR